MKINVHNSIPFINKLVAILNLAAILDSRK